MNRIAEKAIAEFGGFDTWVNNAGVSIFGRCMDVSIPDMKWMFDTNFWGYLSSNIQWIVPLFPYIT
ncbi:hypothetical protein [Nostoc sp. 'Peltigera malacea cyanobiont' DB3992]|uniref:hypothetical protein n=1 Tax=Nostoc sp. 'Peltigera malacea cyanobiont' DB3992 TaxID=1206980 RepID=UPI00211E0BAC|nr:hypothetical protein [Nostoc sp. 'Peltigera malacea cyanobiont' DB3992]